MLITRLSISPLSGYDQIDEGWHAGRRHNTAPGTANGGRAISDVGPKHPVDEYELGGNSRTIVS